MLSHDQVEAALMRKAGYEVRVLPVEGGSWEENPPTLLEFIRRDIRWCQGNLQYLKLLDMPGLQPMSRFQLAWAILMFLGIPAWTLMIAFLPVLAWEARSISDYPTMLAIALYVTFFTMYLSPKIAGLIDAALTPGAVSRYGGRLRFAASALIELVFSFLLGAVSTIRTTIFMIGLPFGKSVTWGAQARDVHGISWGAAVVAFWPQMLFGVVICGALLAISPTVLLWSLPLTAGYLLAVPFGVLTAHPELGRFLQRAGLCGIPRLRSAARNRGRADQVRMISTVKDRLSVLEGDPRVASLRRSLRSTMETRPATRRWMLSMHGSSARATLHSTSARMSVIALVRSVGLEQGSWRSSRSPTACTYCVLFTAMIPRSPSSRRPVAGNRGVSSCMSIQPIQL